MYVGPLNLPRYIRYIVVPVLKSNKIHRTRAFEITLLYQVFCYNGALYKEAPL